MAEEGIGSMTDGARDELRELLFDGVAPPPDTDLMFERTFSASGDDGAHLLPPDDLFDVGDPVDDLPLDDSALDDAAPLDDGVDLDLGDATLDDDAADWSDATPEPSTDDPVDAPDVPFDHPTSGW